MAWTDWTGTERARSSAQWSGALRSTATTSTSSSGCRHHHREATGALDLPNRLQTAIGKIVEAVIIRLVGALMLETNDEWAVARRYMSLESLARVTDNPNVRLPAVAA